MRKLLPTLLPILILAVALFTTRSLLHPGWYASHDGIFHIYRSEEALSMLKLGQLPLRWAGNFDQGFGIPLFNFIYPLPYYLSGVLSYFIGVVWSLKTITIISYAAGGVGVYYLLKSSGELIAGFAAIIYLLTPYQLVNIFVRGTLGETMALGVIPWVLLSFANLSTQNSKLRYFHPLPLAILLCVHNFLGVLFAVFMVGYALTQKSIKKSLFSLGISFALAAFFLIPMITERPLLYSYSHPDLNFRFDQHFATFKQLLYSKWGYWYSVPGDDDGMSFQLGFAQIAISLIGSLLILLKSRSAKNLYLISAYFGSIYLMTARSFWIWSLVPILQIVQFPWRFLFMPAILTVLFIPTIFKALPNSKFQKIFMILILSLAVFNVRNYTRPMKFFSDKEFTDLYRLYLNKTSTTFRSEILPKWSTEFERYKSDELLVNSGNMTIDNLTYTPLELRVSINNKPDNSPAQVTILRNYFPSWVMKMDGHKSVVLSPTSEGMIKFSPELGVHQYHLAVGSTVIEKLSNLTSLLSLVYLGYLWLANRTRKNRSVIKSS